MAKMKWKGGALLSPVPPAMVSCSHGGKDNIITIAWTGIVNTDPPKTYISVRPSRHSYEMIKQSGVFAINLTTKELARSADWCGVYTGAKVDKFERCKLTKGHATEIDCVTVEESPLTLECRVTDIIPLGTHDMFLADIVAVDVDDRLIDEKGKLCLEKAGLVAYAHGDYFELGKRIGGFGYSVAKKKKKPAKRNKRT
ncbi:MAG: flavin reductase family protein [Ruminococcaceae bacterium]|nr:flavin reductase family protein [Oscillospiraceae bacterium]